MASNSTGEILSPSQLNTLARDLLEGAFPLVWVEGELSGVARPSSGHLYFCLKDARAQVRCAMFKPKSTWLKFAPREGMKVLARASYRVRRPRASTFMPSRGANFSQVLFGLNIAQRTCARASLRQKYR